MRFWISKLLKKTKFTVEVEYGLQTVIEVYKYSIKHIKKMEKINKYPIIFS